MKAEKRNWALAPEVSLEGSMARRIWIAILGFGLVLFILLDAAMLWYAMASNKRGFGALAVLIFSTWQVYLAMRKRIDSEPKKGKIDQSF
jgi:hypothetical protein